jgi:hypothetical protein
MVTETPRLDWQFAPAQVRLAFTANATKTPAS